ncbi:MAG: hypothetical protein Q9219_005714 [cf. Caloplaca sp. 3 TL-2023]
MAFPDYQTPDLASVLQTLAAYAPPLQPQPQPHHQPQPADLEELEEGEYDPSDFQPILPSPSSQRPPSHPLSTPRSSTPIPPPKPPPPNITSWPPALRHTTHLLTTTPSLIRRLRHIICTAHQHERQWWSGREALVARLASRKENQRKLDSVLASVGGVVTATGNTGSHAAAADAAAGGTKTEEEDADAEKELKIYDRKVHKAYTEMVGATRVELGKMGIPFFNAKDEGQEGKLEGQELEKLRGRMVEFLEDMVKE